MKKVFIILLVLCMSFCLFSCQDSSVNKEYKYFLTVSDTVITMEKNDQTVITASYSDNKTVVSFESTNDAVATVSSDGTVKAVNAGKCYIVISAGDEVKSCAVTVLDPVYTVKLIYPEETLIVGAKTSITALVYREGVKTDIEIDWTVTPNSNCKIEELDNGTIVFTAIGSGEFSVKANAGKCSAECVLRVELGNIG